MQTDFQTILNTASIPLHRHEQAYVDFPSSVFYSAISYAPQSFAIFILEKLDVPTLLIYYGARIMALLFWLVCAWYSIRILPIGKWLFTLLALLPMTVAATNSLSADVVTNAISFLLIATCLRYAYTDKAFTVFSFFRVVLLGMMVASSKFVYAPLVLLIFLVPPKKFGSLTMQILKKVFFFVIILCTMLFWSKMSGNLYTAHVDYNPKYVEGLTLTKEGNMPLQIEYVKVHYVNMLVVFVHSFIKGIRMWGPGYIGTFGWLDTFLPWWLILAGWFTILLVTKMDWAGREQVLIRHKLIFIACFLASVFLLLLSQYLTWEGVGSQLIYTIQGRYFIPLFPLLFLCIPGSYQPTGNGLKLAVAGFTIPALLISCLVLYLRFFVPQ